MKKGGSCGGAGASGRLAVISDPRVSLSRGRSLWDSEALDEVADVSGPGSVVVPEPSSRSARDLSASGASWSIVDNICTHEIGGDFFKIETKITIV